jgi:hypothetical protein
MRRSLAHALHQLSLPEESLTDGLDGRKLLNVLRGVVEEIDHRLTALENEKKRPDYSTGL